MTLLWLVPKGALNLLDKQSQPVLSCLFTVKMGDIPKPDLVDLINLFIGWGLSFQKKWLNRRLSIGIYRQLRDLMHLNASK